MRPRLFPVLGAASVALFFIILGLAVQFANADEPGRFGRLFRFKQPSAASTPHEISPPDSLRSPVRNNEASESTPSPSLARLVPQARTSQAATEADPLVTRISLAVPMTGSNLGCSCRFMPTAP